MFVSWRMEDDYWSWSPCDLEALGASLAVEKCSFFILRSNKPTLVFPDNKCVIQAFEKLKKGGESSIRLYNTEEVPLINGQVVQRPPPKKNDIIYFVSRKFNEKWVRAKLLSNELRGYKNYCNIEYENKVKDEVYLIPGELWTLGEIEERNRTNYRFHRVINFEDVCRDDFPGDA